MTKSNMTLRVWAPGVVIFSQCGSIDRGLTDIKPIKDRVKNLMFDDFIDPIDKDLKPIIENQEGREKRLSETQVKLNALLTQKKKKEYEAKAYMMGLWRRLTTNLPAPTALIEITSRDLCPTRML